MHPIGLHLERSDLAFPLVRGYLWTWLDLNQRPHPHQGSAHGLVSPGWNLRPGRTMYRWRPLRTARPVGSRRFSGPVTVVTSMAVLTGEDHQGLATASTFRWGLLLSEP